jgi:hypothetical protein
MKLVEQALGRQRRSSVSEKTMELLQKQDRIRSEGARPNTRSGEHDEDAGRPASHAGRPTTRLGAVENADDDAPRPETNSGLRPETNSGLRPETNSGLRPGTNANSFRALTGTGSFYQRPSTNSGPRPGTNGGVVKSDGTVNLAPANPFNRPKTQEKLDRLSTAPSAAGTAPSNGRLGDNSAEVLEARRVKMKGRKQAKKDSSQNDDEEEKSDDEAVCCF